MSAWVAWTGIITNDLRRKMPKRPKMLIAVSNAAESYRRDARASPSWRDAVRDIRMNTNSRTLKERLMTTELQDGESAIRWLYDATEMSVAGEEEMGGEASRV